MVDVIAALLMGFGANQDATLPEANFQVPETVELVGYDGQAMEPFLSRDGAYLFFNSRNRPEDQTDIHLARQISPTRFEYVGPLEGANSDELDGVPSLDQFGQFYFVSPRAYGQTRITLWSGRFDGSQVTDVAALSGSAVRNAPFRLNMDAEINAEGTRLYFTKNRWRIFGGGIAASDLHLAVRHEDGSFELHPDSAQMFEALNTSALEFAPATTPDERTLYFTRVEPEALDQGAAEAFAIYVATRLHREAAFGIPERIATIEGYVEAPTVSPDGCDLYFHKLVQGVFRIQVARRSDCGLRP